MGRDANTEVTHFMVCDAVPDIDCFANGNAAASTSLYSCQSKYLFEKIFRGGWSEPKVKAKEIIGPAAGPPFLNICSNTKGREVRNPFAARGNSNKLVLSHICNGQYVGVEQAQNFPVAGPVSATIGYGHDAEHDPSYRPYGLPPDTLIHPDRAQGIAQPDVPSDRR